MILDLNKARSFPLAYKHEYLSIKFMKAIVIEKKIFLW
jgi:hypothetical protein